jgi:hypothetical protein
MDRNTYRDDDETDETDAYWRRRTIALAAGLGLLAVLAWAFTGGGGRPARVSMPPAGLQTPGAQTPAAQTPAAQTSGLHTPGLLPAAASPSARADTLPGLAGPATTPSADPVVRCSPGALVLSLFAGRASYPGGQYPAFEVYAVSTAAGRCAFDLGPGKLHVVVSSAGRVVWDSADCPGPAPSRMAELTRGVPVQKLIVWNRAVTLPGCVRLATARPGSYQVQARTAASASPVRTIRLDR